MSLNILLVTEKNSWVEYHIGQSLIDMGHQVFTYYFGDYISEYYGFSRHKERKLKNIDLITVAKTLHREHHLDLIFCYVYDDFLLKKYAKALNQLDVPLVNYNVDMPTQWYRQIKTAKYFTKILCAQPNRMVELHQYGKNTLLFPMASKPFVEIVTEQSIKLENPVTFLGTATEWRKVVLSELLANDMTISIYGKYWKERLVTSEIGHFEKTCFDIINYSFPRLKAEGLQGLMSSLTKRFKTKSRQSPMDILEKALGGMVLNHQISEIFNQSAINIGITRFANFDPSLPGDCQMKLRDFEVPMAGGFYLVEKSPGYDDCFVDGKECVTWSTIGELKDKLHYYLSHDSERKQIAYAGQLRAKRDHSWEARFNYLFSELNLHDSQYP